MRCHVAGAGRRGAGIQHFVDVRFFPMLPRARTLAMDSGANGTLQAVPPTSTVTAPIAFPVPRNEGSLIERTDRLESDLIQGALERFRWNKTKAAQELGLSRVGLRAKLLRFGLEAK